MNTKIVIAVVLIAFIVAVKVFLERKAKSAQGTQLNHLPQTIQDKLRQRGQVLLYLFSPTCGVCRQVTPVIDKLSEQQDNIFKINIIESAEVVRELRVMGTPTTVLIRANKVERVIVGLVSESKLRELLA